MRSRIVCLCLLAGLAGLAACSSATSDVQVGRADQPATSGSETTSDPTPPTQPSAPVDPQVTETTAEPSETSDAPELPELPDDPVGVGDSLFPDLGNAAIDVEHYDIDVAYDPDQDEISATVTLTVTALVDASSIALDAVGLDVTDVQLDGTSAPFEAQSPELFIGAGELTAGDSVDVAVTYTAMVHSVDSPAGSSAGWFSTNGGSFVLNEPDGARTWMPSNDHPLDRATYRFTIHVPAGVTAAANGVLVEQFDDATGEVFVWEQTEPMTTYVVQLMTGQLDLVEGRGPHSLPLVSVLQDGDEELMQPYLDVTVDQIEFFEGYFGPFPFDSYGLAMSNGFVGGAMEQQGRSLFSRDDFASGDLGHYQHLLLSHELSHQWFGDGVTLGDWSDIWLNESFATYGEWMWLDHAGFATVEDLADSNLEQRQGGGSPTGSPDPGDLFGYQVYDGGAVVLHALRLSTGDEQFFEILRRWVQDNLDTARTTPDFIALVNEVTGDDYAEFFEEWLYSSDLPDEYPA